MRLQQPDQIENSPKTPSRIPRQEERDIQSCLANEQTKPRPRGGARPPMLTIRWVAGYSTCVLPVNMPVASAIQSLQLCLRFGEVCAWRGLTLTEPANCDLRPHDFWRMAVKNWLRLDVKWQCTTSSCGSGGTGRRARLRILWPKNRGGSNHLSRAALYRKPLKTYKNPHKHWLFLTSTESRLR